jgi:thiol-disulfide isomerase/thioredoxin
MKKLAISLILLSSLLFASGCAEKAQENSTNHQNIQNKSIVVEATKLNQINTFLQKGPVLLEIGAPGCSDCQKMKKILPQVASDYGDKITVISINMSKSPKLADYFGAYFVPVSFVIIGIKNGNYTYMREDGSVSTNVSKAKIVGLRDKGVFEKILDTALSRKK